MSKLDKPAKVCPGCGRVFSLLELVESPELRPIGMQFIDEELTHNVYYFSHICPDCGTTFVVSVSVFVPLINEPIPPDSLAGTEECDAHCIAIEDLALCSKPCRYAPFRRFLLHMRNRHPSAMDTQPITWELSAGL